MVQQRIVRNDSTTTGVSLAVNDDGFDHSVDAGDWEDLVFIVRTMHERAVALKTKSANIVLSHDYTAKLIDCGLAT
jgi:hypothetical protein